LKDLCVIGITIENAEIGVLCAVVVFLLLVNMSDLEPNVFFRQGRGWRIYDVLEAFQRLSVLLLLLVDDAKAKVDLMRLVKVWRHVHDLREGLFGMVK